MNKVIQFGEGGFLRGFCDWMIQFVNEKTDWNGAVTVVQPIPTGLCKTLEENGCRYTHVCRGTEGVFEKEISCISRTVNPYEDFEAYLALAEEKDFRFVISNTTESGIACDESDRFEDTPPKSFPAKLCRLLYRRWELGLQGFVFLPCELIDKNGENLLKCLLTCAEKWNLGEAFARWLREENTFCNTLVDRINTGCPDPATPLVNTSEYFHLWVIEGCPDLFREFPLDKANLNVILTDDLERYRTRKVRILNGAHTCITPYGLLEGLESVKDCITSPLLSEHLNACLFEEIIPSLDMSEEEATSYAKEVLNRFANPHIHHRLASISLNSVSKFKVRVLPSLRAYQRKTGKMPQRLIFSLAKLIEFYRVGTPTDDEAVCAFMKKASTAEILANTALWGEDLSDLLEEVAKVC